MTAKLIRHIDSGATCCDPQWEAAYLRFETPEEEIEKFVRRLRAFGLDKSDKQQRVVELFSGRGNGMVALSRLGFNNLEGVDLSEELLVQYRGEGTLHLADCRKLPFDDASVDIAIVQGGLHHLPRMPQDLDETLGEVRRSLKPEGTFYVVEPWRTPFLTLAHAVTDLKIVRRFYAKGDALAEMTEHEWDTYQQWLSMPAEVMAVFEKHFQTKSKHTAWGKLTYVGTPRAEGRR